MKLAWLTDVHLDFLDVAGIAHFAETVAAQAPDAVLIGGTSPSPIASSRI